MAGVFRFSNAVSDIDKFIDTYKRIYEYFIEWTDDNKFFNHSDAAIFLAQNGLATSLGAVGNEALNRSTRDDKSRDPLYNQHKSYSEMFRMLGWYEPGNMQTNFKLPEYGSYIADTNDSRILKKLFCMNLKHIVSPNPLTNVKGNNILRPFPFMLKLMNITGGCISRDEIIIGVLACENDKQEHILEETAERILQIRDEGLDSLELAMEQLKAKQNIKSKDTLPNYTRFPISALKWTGWAEAKSTRKVYQGEKSVKMLFLTEEGSKIANELVQMPDIRYDNLLPYKERERIAFIALANLQKMESCGFDLSTYNNIMYNLLEMAKPILKDFNVHNKEYLFFGYQEAPREDLKKVDQLLELLE